MVGVASHQLLVIRCSTYCFSVFDRCVKLFSHIFRTEARVDDLIFKRYKQWFNGRFQIPSRIGSNRVFVLDNFDVAYV